MCFGSLGPSPKKKQRSHLATVGEKKNIRQTVAREQKHMNKNGYQGETNIWNTPQKTNIKLTLGKHNINKNTNLGGKNNVNKSSAGGRQQTRYNHKRIKNKNLVFGVSKCIFDEFDVSLLISMPQTTNKSAYVR
jgi:hypothetical protein